MGITLLLLLFFSVEAQTATPVTPVNLSKAKWIKSAEPAVQNESQLFGDQPAPYFRKEFVVSKRIQKATLTIAAAGYYLASVNGIRVENNLLDPAWTNFSKRIYYSSYDVTPQIRAGKNAVGTILGNGFYNLLPLRMWGSRNLRQVVPTGEPMFIALLQLIYSDGTREEISTDDSWKYSKGPILRNSVYLGEVYDAGKAIPGWDKPGFSDDNWKKAVTCSGSGGLLQAAFFPPVKVTDTFQPITINRTKTDIFIVDAGVNISGTYRIHMRGSQGDTVVFRFGERLYADGSLNPMTTVAGQIKRKGSAGPGGPEIAWQTDSYIFGKEKEVWYQPNFTSHTFRYMEIAGLKTVPNKADIQLLNFHTAVENINNFSCSSELLNKIQEACRRTFLDNLISVQSDCPARERFGYGGDLNATSEAYITNFDMKSFYRKTIYDWVDAMQDSIFIDTAPYVGIKYCGISWESAFLTTQDKLFQYFGDTALVKELYQKDLEWMKKVERLHPDGLIDKGLSDHESLLKVPVQLIGTTHYIECTRIMQRFAGLMKDPGSVARFAALERSLTQKVLERFWRKPVPGPINRQTLFATLLYYNLIPSAEKPMAVDSLLKAVQNGPASHFTTGIFGTKYILEALSQNGHAEEVFKIVNSTAYPGWGFMIDRGATTIWETWKESDNTYSNCHPMFGSVSEWFTRWLTGIRPIEGFPAFKKFWIAPIFPPDLTSAKSTYHCPAGDIKVEWVRNVNNKIKLNVVVPQGCTGIFCPASTEALHWIVTNVNTHKLLKSNQNPKESFKIELPDGTYEIVEE